MFLFWFSLLAVDYYFWENAHMKDLLTSPWILAPLIQLAGLWIFFFGYNVLVCSLPRLPFKYVLRYSLFLCFVVGLPLSLLFGRHSTWLEPVLYPQTWHGAHTVVAAVLLVAMLMQIPVTLRILRPGAVRFLKKRTLHEVHFKPKPGDWEFYRKQENIHQPQSGTVTHKGKSLPRYQRRVQPVDPHPWMTRLIRATLARLDQTYDLRVIKMTLELPHLPTPFNGLRIAHLADNHYGSVLSPRWHEHVVKETLALKPDLIVLTGDYTAEDNLYRQAIEALADLRAPLGVYAVRGNHDFFSEPEILEYWLRRTGIRLLSNNHVDIERDGAIFRIFGTEHPYKRVKNFQRVMKPAPNAFCLALSHLPDNVFHLARNGADLILTGHTHGGQWRLPFIGPVIFPSIYGRRFDLGLREVQGTLLYNSAGFGLHTIPFRFHCPPEIALFELH
ncbi:TPA: hypothetical protein DDW35_00625, partial [Candidatus Sumerlaeota bacterium]|nr:hypothetical protein [Candidatus Sumerlaeota bacterium]